MSWFVLRAAASAPASSRAATAAAAPAPAAAWSGVLPRLSRASRSAPKSQRVCTTPLASWPGSAAAARPATCRGVTFATVSAGADGGAPASSRLLTSITSRRAVAAQSCAASGASAHFDSWVLSFHRYLSPASVQHSTQASGRVDEDARGGSAQASGGACSARGDGDGV